MPTASIPHDRWAITAYIRALQLSRRATVAQVPDAAEHIQMSGGARQFTNAPLFGAAIAAALLVVARLSSTPKARRGRLAGRLCVLGANPRRQSDAH